MANGFGCRGDNQSPQLSWKNPPAGTRSYAVTAYDPDAPTGSGWWHWQAGTSWPTSRRWRPTPVRPRRCPRALSADAATPAPSAIGACPPQGDKPHRYVFTVHALKVDTLELPENPMPALVGFMIGANC